MRGELVTAAMQRARMCELLAEATGRWRDAGALFMAGLFSLLDARMRAPMAEVVDRLDLAPELRGTLLDREGPYATTLRLVEAFEGGRWDDVTRAADALPLSLTELTELYARAVEWARERSVEGSGAAERAA